ncbi:ABC transporter permease [Chitinophaga cymbidii]|uniref:ABC transporter permease n=1 Tax=Chitinophaga cymbidii TaxID=1096750 RepID=A0A512RRQ9_9BACT|nr:ABC transporter permease [Chitinophaga cymbidii]GEP98389.1 ABC transporter permease [Chitinophaga cymbidii]
MIKNYLKLAFRTLWKNRVYSTINILGLAIGMAACFFIFQYVRFESSYDKFHANADRLYRVLITYGGSFGNGTNAVNHPAVGPAMKAEFPEVEAFARLAPAGVFIKSTTLSFTDSKGETKRFNEAKSYFADGSFLTMFSFPFVSGTAATALEEPGTAVLSETTARKYFGNEDPLNKVLYINGFPIKVTGVFREVPENSHIHFNLLISLSTIDKNFGYGEWGWPEFYNYVALAPGADTAGLAKKLPAFVEKHLGAKMRELNFRTRFSLQPVTDIHLKSDHKREVEPNGSERTIYFLTILGVFILIIAWINYINLSTAKSMERAREVGLRKAVGATRAQLTIQFIFESLIINFIALFLAAAIVIASAGYFDRLTGKDISGSFLGSGLWQQWKFWLALLLVFLAGALQVGAYPAFVLSSFKPVLVLKGKLIAAKGNISLRKALVAFQFVLSIMLIAGSLTIYRQLSYMRNQELGYSKEQMLIVKAPAITDSTFNAKTEYFKAALLKNAAITHMAPSSEIPGNTIFARNSVRKINQDKTHNFITNLVEIDQDFIPAYKAELVAGRNLTDAEKQDIFESKRAKVLVNEALVQALGFASNEAALRQEVFFVSWFGDIRSEIVGVVKNYHQRSLREHYDPILYYQSSNSQWSYFSININTNDLSRNLQYVSNLYQDIFPGNAFESFFLDEYFDRQYQADARFGDIFSLFTILAIIVACLGLIGLSTFAIKLRTREIGIRKVLGATTQSIIYLFSKDFIKLVVLAALIASPVIYFVARQWLMGFAFHIRLNLFIFIAPPLLLMALSLLTIGLQSLKAALSNPVNVLRNE